ncbi:speckle-type POZ protein [Trichonephila clavipes]|nr:speckle-type POZ protein [Trichonephila clavipes]
MDGNNGGNSLAPFIYIWAIGNFPALLCPFPLISPLFIIDDCGKSHWRIVIAESAQYIQYVVQRQDDNEPQTVCHSSEISLLDTEGCPLITEIFYCSFKKGGTCINLTFALISDVFGLRRDKFLSNETLTLRFRCFSIQKKTNRINMCCARTRLDIQRRSFLWTIRNFSSLREGESVSRALRITENKWLYLTLQLTEEGNVNMRFASNVEVRFNCRISIFDMTGKSRTILFCRSQIDDPQHFDLMEKAYLEANRESFLPVGILTL